MGTLIVPGETGQVSDGYHTFDELYEHRCLLFLNVVKALTDHRDRTFKTRRNQDGEEWSGWFILGMNTDYGQITYHLPDKYWDMADVREVERNTDYDGHTSYDVAARLLDLAGCRDGNNRK